MEPKKLLDLQLAKEQCCAELGLSQIGRAIDSFYKRRRLEVLQEGKTFKRAICSIIDCSSTEARRGG